MNSALLCRFVYTGALAALQVFFSLKRVFRFIEVQHLRSNAASGSVADRQAYAELELLLQTLSRQSV